MNNYLRDTYHKLPSVSRDKLRREFAGAPRMLLLLDLLEQSADRKFGVHEAVAHIYADEQHAESFDVLRNRFFKLRKKLTEALEQRTSASAEDKNSSAAVLLLPLEAEYYRCRTLIQNNHFQEARKRLEKLIAECWEKNIFELLPDAINHVIFCNFTMNVFRDNDRLFADYERASELLASLNQQRICARRAYEKAIHYQYDKVRPFIARMKTIALQHKEYPRFELYYQFSAFTIGSSSYGNDIRVLARHQNRVKELMKKYPDIPSGQYEVNAYELMQYYMVMAEGFYAYQRGDAEECYRCFVESWRIAETTPNFRIRKSDSQYSNRIVIEIATGRYREALKTADAMLDFMKDQKEEGRRLKAYAEIMQVYTFAYPALTAPDPEFLLSKVNEYIRLLRAEKPIHYNETILTKAVFLMITGKTKELMKFRKDPDFQGAFAVEEALPYMEIINAVGKKNDPAKIAGLRKSIEHHYGKSRQVNIILGLKRALILLDLLEVRK